MILGIGIDFREPYDFFAVYDLAVYDRADLSVAAARVETYSATVEMSTDFQRTLFLFREILIVAFYDFEFGFVNPFHKALIESPYTVFRISLFDIFEYSVVAAVGGVNM